MNINIALNTIIYLMVFLFPGVLFLKFYFSGKFKRQFEQGHLLERFVWYVLSSIICLGVFGLMFQLIKSIPQVELLNNIKFDNIIDIFKNISKNEFPETLVNWDDFISFFTLMIFIYFVSSVFGYLMFISVRALSLDSNFSLLKFSNDWEYLNKAHRKNGINRKIGDIHKTYIDVLVNDNNEEILFTGTLKDLMVNKDNELEGIAIYETNKFISVSKDDDSKVNYFRDDPYYSEHKEYTDKIVFKKRIDGHVFIIPYKNVVNLNFTYVKEKNKFDGVKGFIHKTLMFIYTITIIILFIIPFIEISFVEQHIPYFNDVWRRTVFSIFTFFIFTLVLVMIEKILFSPNSGREVYNLSLFAIFLAIPYLWVFGYLTIGRTVLCVIISFFVMVYISKTEKTKPIKLKE